MTYTDLVKLVHTLWIPIFLCMIIYRTTMQSFREFIDALHSPGTAIVGGFALLLIGIVMMKVMLYDDGKYIVGAGVGLICKSLDGKTPATPGTTNTAQTATTEQQDKDPHA